MMWFKMKIQLHNTRMIPSLQNNFVVISNHPELPSPEPLSSPVYGFASSQHFIQMK